MGMLLDESSQLDSTEFTDGTEDNSPQPSQSETSGAYWAGQTMNCPNCEIFFSGIFLFLLLWSPCKNFTTIPSGVKARRVPTRRRCGKNYQK